MTDTARAIPARLNLVLLVAASAACAGLLHAASHAQSATVVVGAALGFALTANTLFALLHEGVHRVLHPVPAVNDWAARVAGAWFPTGLGVQRVFHLTHHRNNRSRYEQFDILHEGDIVWLKRAQWYSILTGLYWVITVAGVLAYLLVPRALRVRVLRENGSQVAEQTSSGPYLAALDSLHPVRARLEVAFAVAFQLALFHVLDLSVVGWLACYGAFALAWSSLQYADHAFSPLDAATGAWNLRVGLVARAFFLDYHRHLTHHQDPQLPWIHLKRHTDPAAPEPTFWRVWLAMWAGPRSPDSAREAGRRLATERNRRPCFADLPSAAHLRTSAFLAAGVALWFLVVYGGASLLSTHVPWRVRVDLPFETAIPFVPWSAAVYLSITVLLALGPFVLRRTRELVPFVAALVIQTAVAAVVFLALPVESAFPERIVDGGAELLFRVADTLNLENNFLPSLHVAFAATAVLAYLPNASRVTGAGLGLWGAAIAVATVLMHEHHVADVGAGLALAGAVWWAVCAHRTAIYVEWLCLSSFVRFSRRHRRYAVVALGVTGASLPRWRARRVLRTGFCFLQQVDDLLDGDRECEGEPLDVVDRVVHALRSGRFADDDLMQLAEAFSSDLTAVGGEAALNDALALIAVMQEDRRRVLERRISSRAECEIQLRRTFQLSVDLMLVGGGAKVRARDVPELVEALGWCSVMRDLREDLDRGLVNVPADVLRDAAAETASISHDELVGTAAVRSWMCTERDRAIEMLDATDGRLGSLGDARGVRVLRMFSRSIRGVALRRLPKRYPFLAVPAPERRLVTTGRSAPRRSRSLRRRA